MELMEILDSKKVMKVSSSDLTKGRDISGVKIKLLHPPPEGNRYPPGKRFMNPNDNSLVLKLSYAGKSFLFPGDLEKPGEETVVSNAGSLLESDILLTPHHGSKSSSSRPFLEMVKPRICIISSGGGNYFGHPHSKTLQRLRDIGCRIIRIDQVGAVQLSVGPNGLKVRSFLD